MGYRHGRADRTTRRSVSRPVMGLLAAALVGLTSWLLHRAERDYQGRGQLSAVVPSEEEVDVLGGVDADNLNGH